MNQYVKFIVRVLLTCFLLPFRRHNTSLMRLTAIYMGLDVGHFYNGTILTQSCLA